MEGNFDLVIQGPLVHQGFNTIPLVERSLRLFRHLFDSVVVSSWEGEKLDAVRGLEILCEKFSIESIVLPMPKTGSNFQTRNLHYYSSLRGLENLPLSDNPVVKIRSDLFVDLGEVTKFYMMELKKFDKPRIGCLWSYKTKPFAVCDYLYIAPVNNLKYFFQTQLAFCSQNFSLGNLSGGHWPERNSVLAYLYSLRRDQPELFEGLSEFDFFPKVPKDIQTPWNFFFNGLNTKQHKLQNLIFRDFFVLMPEAVAMKTSMRRSDNRPWQRSDLFFYEDQQLIESIGYSGYLKKHLFCNYKLRVGKLGDVFGNFLGKAVATKLNLYALPSLAPIYYILSKVFERK